MLLSYMTLGVQHDDVKTTNYVSIFISLVFCISVEPTIHRCAEAKPPTPLLFFLRSTSPQTQLSLFFLCMFGLIHLPTLFLLCLQPPV